MHELSISLQTIDLVVEQAKKHQVKKVTGITLSIGALSCIEEQALQTGIELAARETLAEGAKLIIETIAATAWCMDCQRSVSIENHLVGCPCCQGYQLMVETGEELQIKHIEVL